MSGAPFMICGEKNQQQQLQQLMQKKEERSSEHDVDVGHKWQQQPPLPLVFHTGGTTMKGPKLGIQMLMQLGFWDMEQNGRACMAGKRGLSTLEQERASEIGKDSCRGRPHARCKGQCRQELPSAFQEYEWLKELHGL